MIKIRKKLIIFYNNFFMHLLFIAVKFDKYRKSAVKILYFYSTFPIFVKDCALPFLANEL